MGYTPNTTTSNELYAVANSTVSSSPFVVLFTNRDPTGNDLNYPIQKIWLNTSTNIFWFLKNFISNNGNVQANWIVLNQGIFVETLTGDDAVVVDPVNNNIDVLGNTVSNGTNAKPVYFKSGGTGVLDLDVQVTEAAASSDINNAGLASFNDSDFSVDSNGYVSALAFSVNNQVFTSSGTYTPTSGMLYCQITMVGGGGGGGGATTTGASQSCVGAGGGGGEWAQGSFSASTIGASQTVTIGAAGTNASGSAGGTGGTTSVGSLITAVGGTGGAIGTAGASSQAAGGSGGTGGSGGDIRSPGMMGAPSNASFGTFVFTGAGGNSHYGYGGSGLSGSFTTGTSATNYGAGGGGAAANQSNASTTAGGASTKGVVIITEYIIA